MNRFASSVAALVAAAVVTLAAAKTLDIYFIDVEGGQATLIVTPESESLLVDAGFPGEGTFEAKPGEADRGRDAVRIAAAAREAGLSRIDYLLITHFHADHDGGVVELARMLPIRTFIDHGDVPPEAEETSRGTLKMFRAYAAVREKGRHLQPKPGDRLPLKGVEATVVSAACEILAKPMPGAGAITPGCPASAPAAQEPNENPRSTGFMLRYGAFRFLDVGDLTGEPLFGLVCPIDRIGLVDVYLVAHHGGADAADPATFAAFKPRVAVINNGARKGGAPNLLAAVAKAPGIEDVWQLHRSLNTGAHNAPDDRIANLDETTAHWIKLSASDNGSFTIQNGRTGAAKTYPARRR